VGFWGWWVGVCWWCGWGLVLVFFVGFFFCVLVGFFLCFVFELDLFIAVFSITPLGETIGVYPGVSASSARSICG